MNALTVLGGMGERRKEGNKDRIIERGGRGEEASERGRRKEGTRKERKRKKKKKKRKKNSKKFFN